MSVSTVNELKLRNSTVLSTNLDCYILSLHDHTNVNHIYDELHLPPSTRAQYLHTEGGGPSEVHPRCVGLPVDNLERRQPGAIRRQPLGKSADNLVAIRLERGGSHCHLDVQWYCAFSLVRSDSQPSKDDFKGESAHPRRTTSHLLCFLFFMCSKTQATMLHLKKKHHMCECVCYNKADLFKIPSRKNCSINVRRHTQHFQQQILPLCKLRLNLSIQLNTLIQKSLLWSCQTSTFGLLFFIRPPQLLFLMTAKFSAFVALLCVIFQI